MMRKQEQLTRVAAQPVVPDTMAATLLKKTVLEIEYKLASQGSSLMSPAHRMMMPDRLEQAAEVLPGASASMRRHAPWFTILVMTIA